MKKKFFFIVVCFMALTGCRENDKRETTEAIGNLSKYHYTLTEDEKELLINMYMAYDEVETGELYDFEAKAIDIYRAMNQYLQNKYPDLEYTVTTYETKDVWNPMTKLVFLPNGSETEYTVCMPDEEKMEFKDSYAAFFYNPLYAETVSRLCEDIIASEYVVFCNIRGFFDITQDAALGIEDILKLENTKAVSVYVDCPIPDEAEAKKTADMLEQKLRDENQDVVGHVYFVEGFPLMGSADEQKKFMLELKNDEYSCVFFSTKD